MISIKTPEEIEIMRVAGEIVGDTHKYLIPYLKPAQLFFPIYGLKAIFLIKLPFESFRIYPNSSC